MLAYAHSAYGTLYAAEAYGQYILGLNTDNIIELTQRERERVFNLGYFTWCEQQDIDYDLSIFIR